VTRKVLEAFFRNKLLILLPLIVVPLLATPIALLVAPPQYEAAASLWFERPAAPGQDEVGSQSPTSAQEEANRLRELLGTRAFRANVARRTQLAPLLDSEAGEEEVRKIISRGARISSSGERLLNVSFRGPTPQLPLEMSQGIVDAFGERWAADHRGRALRAVSVFESRLKQAEDELSVARETLRRSSDADPRLAALALSRGVDSQTRLPVLLSTTDVRLVELIRDVELQEQQVAQLRTRLQQARLDSAAAMEDQVLPLRVADTPRLPTQVSLGRNLALLATAAVLTALALSIGLLALFAAVDRSVRSADDPVLPRTRPISAIPDLMPAGRSEPAFLGLTRRAVGHAAGTVLREAT
jgi:hypothetical protein